MTERENYKETASSEATWTGRDFRSYLFALSYGTSQPNHCLESRRFPRRIELSSDWHEALNKMRSQTASDHHEYWTLIGVTAARDRVFILDSFVQGEQDQVSNALMNAMVAKARESGIPFIVGDAHSHPSSIGILDRVLPYNRNYFSIRDLYNSLWWYANRGVDLLAGPDRNLVVFRTQETRLVPASLSFEEFERQWEHFHSIPGLNCGDELGVNLAIGRQHHIAFYEGKPSQPLTRILP